MPPGHHWCTVPGRNEDFSSSAGFILGTGVEQALFSDSRNASWSRCPRYREQLCNIPDDRCWRRRSYNWIEVSSALTVSVDHVSSGLVEAYIDGLCDSSWTLLSMHDSDVARFVSERACGSRCNACACTPYIVSVVATTSRQGNVAYLVHLRADVAIIATVLVAIVLCGSNILSCLVL